MLSKRNILFRAGLESCYLSGAHRLAAPQLSGCGAILTLHHVRTRRFDAFQPNRSLEITPEFLEQAILHLKQEGFDIVSLDEAKLRLENPGAYKKFIALTFDHASRDVLAHAYPVLKKHGCPFTVYVTAAHADGSGLLWWRALEQVIASREVVTIVANGDVRIYLTGSLEEKHEAFEEIGWWLKTLDQKKLRAFVDDFCATYHFDMQAACREDCMGWSEIAQLAADPLVTIGASAVDHANLSQADTQELARQIREGARIIEAALGIYPKHFSYPYGVADAAGTREFAIAREFGFATAVTTRPGILFSEHKDYLHALPRIAMDGNYQALRYLDALLSGLPSYVTNGFARLSVA